MPRSPFLRLWPLQLLWVGVALAGGDPLADAVVDGSGALAATAWALAGLAWFAALVAMLVPRALSLTVVRLVVPSALAGLGVALLAGDELTALDLTAVALAAAATVTMLAPWTTDAFVDGSSYGPERRIALRTPTSLAALAAVTWAATVAGATVGPLLLADGSWLPGALAVAVGFPVAAAGARAVHQLSRRWLVLVPTGMVLHDPLTMPEAQLFLRQTMVHLGPAEAGDPADATEDLTAGAPGLVMELALSEPVELLVRDGRGTALRAVSQVRFSPARPAALLAEARQRRLPVA